MRKKDDLNKYLWREKDELKREKDARLRARRMPSLQPS